MARKPKKPAVDREDADLLRRAFRDVTLLPGRKIAEDGFRAEAKPLKPDKKQKVTARSSQPDPTPNPDLPVLEPGATPGLDKRTAQRLRRGRMAVEGRLDLHGMTQAEAHPALTDFLAGAQDAGKRCVLVITGKGLRPDGRAGVLRDAVPGWLNSPPNRRRILSFTPATPADGGTGALYILLKRLKRL